MEMAFVGLMAAKLHNTLGVLRAHPFFSIQIADRRIIQRLFVTKSKLEYVKKKFEKENKSIVSLKLVVHSFHLNDDKMDFIR